MGFIPWCCSSLGDEEVTCLSRYDLFVMQFEKHVRITVLTRGGEIFLFFFWFARNEVWIYGKFL